MSAYRKRTHEEWTRKNVGRMFNDPRIQSMLLTERTWNCVWNELDLVNPNGSVATLDDLCQIGRAKWLRAPNMGKKSVDELAEELKRVGKQMGGAPAEPQPPIRARCLWCGATEHDGVCPSVRAIEYFENGKVKRIEFKTAADYPQQPYDWTRQLVGVAY